MREYVEGTLVLDLVGASSQELVWRGTGSRRLRPQTTPEESDRVVRETVNEILNVYPPQT